MNGKTLDRPTVLGVDGGGSGSRAVCVDLAGNVLGAAVGAGSVREVFASSTENIRGVLRQCLLNSGVPASRVVAVAAGLSGLNFSGDMPWAEQCTALEGLECPRVLVNDGMIAHVGALRSRPGVIALAGTMGLAVGVTASGRFVHSLLDFGYVAGGAPWLVQQAGARVMAGLFAPEDRDLVEELFAACQVSSRQELRRSWTDVGKSSHHPFWQDIARFAPAMTRAALAGAPLACLLCDQLLSNVALAVALVRTELEEEEQQTVTCAPVGRIMRSTYMRRSFERHLRDVVPSGSVEIVEPALYPVGGAVLMALVKAGVDITDQLVGHLQPQLAPLFA